MTQTVFVELEFWLLILFSLVVPPLIIWWLLAVRRISRGHVLMVGLLMVAMAGFDVYLLQILKRESIQTPSTADDVVFNSEITLGLYLLPALLAGIGVNVTSHVLLQHLSDAERNCLRGHTPGKRLPRPTAPEENSR
jgi:hypothetical protein